MNNIKDLLVELGGFYKVAENGGTLITNIFWNPETNEQRSISVRDYDYSDGSRDIDELYYMPIDEAMRKNWLHSNGVILEGDTIKVIKGRKVPIGTIARVEKIKPYYDKYHRFLCDYVYLDNGAKTSKENCILVFRREHTL